jgi:hypothetical protein
MVWAVDEYQDVLREKKKPEYWNGRPKHHYFDTREEACHFILCRAAKHVTDAEAALKKARHHHSKCIKKYGAKIK